MAFRIRDIELTAPLPPLATMEDESGLALVLRLRGCPVGFVMRDLPPRTRLSTTETRAEIMKAARLGILTDALRDERAGRPGGARSFEPPVRAPVRSVSVAVRAQDRPALLTRCLRSLERVREDARVDIEVLVVDDASADDRTPAAVRAVRGARCLRGARPGAGAARNRALREAEGDLVAYIDADVVVDRGWLDGLLETAREHPDAAAITGPVLPAELETDAQILFERYGGLRLGFERRRFRGPVMPGLEWYPSAADHFGTGANMAFRRDALLELGGFDAALEAAAPFEDGSDLDMFYRVVRTGRVLVYEPRFLVFRHRRRTRGRLRRHLRGRGAAYMAFLSKSHGWDRDKRGHHRRLLLWWVQHRLRRLTRSVTGRHVLPPDLVVAELWGGVAGFLRGRRRSSGRRRRTMERYS